MSQVGIRELKQNASAVVAEAAAGELVTITDRGRPVAQLVPIGGSRLDALIRAGRARAPRRSIADLPPPIRDRSGGRSLTDEVIAARDDERY
ncbi:MAG TPA: type II toxin-antitoxin system prevent-host-death family antitoxin [Microthrixaceae bacterium]|jgi:prevent-host-death family protein|nr:type II toxin-antitoxin system prevent-host-death family antitoxin [Microthrixaceae bacterium]